MLGIPPGGMAGIWPVAIMLAAIFFICSIYSGDMFFIILLAYLIILGSMLAIIGLMLPAWAAAALSCSSVIPSIMLAYCLS
jgi:hypothetical protein